jgi:DNA-binding response OmpR family regulator
MSELKRKVLIVDDSDGVREGLALCLADEFEVAAASSGEEALDILHRFDPDVVLLDLRLPGMGGEEVLQRLSETPRRSAILVISAVREPGVASRVCRLGAVDYIEKPFGIGLLRERIRELTAA